MAQLRTQRPWAAASWGDPFDQLRREMDALMSRFAGPPRLPNAWSGVFPAVNLYEATDAWVLTAELPGVSPDDIQVSVEGATVTLQGERKVEYADDTSLHRRERQSGTFRRTFELPAAIDADKVEAVHKHGVLMLRLSKHPEQQPRQIPVQAS